MKRHQNPNGQKKALHLQAFSLIEMALCLIIMGIILSITIPLMKSTRTELEEAQCYQRSQKIFHALAGYVLRNHHLPCPALNLDGYAEKNCFQEAPTGYVPYYTLGLSADVAKSRHGRPFIYSVSGKLTQTRSLHEDSPDGSSTLGASFCAIRYANLDKHLNLVNTNAPHQPKPASHNIAVVLVAPGPGSIALPPHSLHPPSRIDAQEPRDRVYSLSRHGLLNAYGQYYCPSDKTPDSSHSLPPKKHDTLW